MRKRLLRYLGAVIVSLVTSYSGLQRLAAADTPDRAVCGLSDVSAWQMQLEQPVEEASPAYVLRVTEDFIARCPDRPEIAEAHRIAGMAAAWLREAERAGRHFDEAGHVTDTETLFMHAAIRVALDEADHAWKLRDEAIEFWLSRMQRRGVASIEIEQVQGGEIIALHFNRADPEAQVSDVWLAKPAGAGWPAAFTVSSERQLTAFHRLRAGEDAAALRHIRFYRCKARSLLARTDEPISDKALADGARLALIAYLASPDVPDEGAFQPCLFEDRMLPDVSPANAIPIQ